MIVNAKEVLFINTCQQSVQESPKGFAKLTQSFARSASKY